MDGCGESPFGVQCRVAKLNILHRYCLFCLPHCKDLTLLTTLFRQVVLTAIAGLYFFPMVCGGCPSVAGDLKETCKAAALDVSDCIRGAFQALRRRLTGGALPLTLADQMQHAHCSSPQMASVCGLPEILQMGVANSPQLSR